MEGHEDPWTLFAAAALTGMFAARDELPPRSFEKNADSYAKAAAAVADAMEAERKARIESRSKIFEPDL